MGPLYRIALRLLPPAFRRRYGAGLEDEARARIAEARASGRAGRERMRLAADLSRAVVREWGDVIVQEARGGMGGGTTTDVRWALRALGRAPGVAVAVILSLGLGIGASTVALGLVDAYLLRSLPYPDGDRLVVVWPGENWSAEMYELAREGLPSLAEVAAAGGATLVLQEGGEPEELFASLATTNLHDVLGVHPFLGRDFVSDDGTPGAEPVTILSWDLWSRRFGADPAVIGRSVLLGGEGFQRRTVIGVMPREYQALQGSGVEAWVPVIVDRTAGDYGNSYFMRAVGRLVAGASIDQANRDTRAWAHRVQELDPSWFGDDRIGQASATSLARERTADRRTPLLLGLAAAALVLIVACANVANLIVARTTAREHELSVRAALGAGRVRTSRTVLTEVALLAAAGGVAGLGVAGGLLRLLESRYPGALPDGGLVLDARWAAAAFALATLAALLAGLVPALQAARRDPARAMGGGRGSSGRRGLSRLQELLSATQLALATAGIAAMGLLGRSLVELGRVGVGFEPAGAVTFRVTAPPAGFPEDGDVWAFFQQVRAALADVPGVEAVGLVSRLPVGGGESRINVRPEGWDIPDGEPEPVAWHRLMTPGYLEALGVELLAGRIPAVEDDRAGAPIEVVVNETAARTFWPAASAVGKRLFEGEGEPRATVVGVVSDIRENGQSAPVLPGIYFPHRDWPWRSMYAVARARPGAGDVLPALRSAVQGVSASAPISREQSLERVVDRGLRGTRSLAVLAGVAGCVTLLLGAFGVYSVVSQAVAGRRRELGVRAALGADRGRLLRGELTLASRIVGVGLAGGLVAAWLAARGLRGALFGVSALDPPTLAGAALLLGAVGYLAAVVPARRAASVDPVRELRGE